MAKHEKSETIKTGMTQYENKGANPTGHVKCDGDHATVDLPGRTMGKDSIKEVHYDCNATLSEGSVKKGKG